MTRPENAQETLQTKRADFKNTVAEFRQFLLNCRSATSSGSCGTDTRRARLVSVGTFRQSEMEDIAIGDVQQALNRLEKVAGEGEARKRRGPRRRQLASTQLQEEDGEREGKKKERRRGVKREGSQPASTRLEEDEGERQGKRKKRKRREKRTRLKERTEERMKGYRSICVSASMARRFAAEQASRWGEVQKKEKQMRREARMLEEQNREKQRLEAAQRALARQQQIEELKKPKALDYEGWRPVGHVGFVGYDPDRPLLRRPKLNSIKKVLVMGPWHSGNQAMGNWLRLVRNPSLDVQPAKDNFGSIVISNEKNLESHFAQGAARPCRFRNGKHGDN